MWSLAGHSGHISVSAPIQSQLGPMKAGPGVILSGLSQMSPRFRPGGTYCRHQAPVSELRLSSRSPPLPRPPSLKSICSTVAWPSCCPTPAGGGGGEGIHYPDLGPCNLCPNHAAAEAALNVDLSTPTTAFCPRSPPGNMINMVSAIRSLGTVPLWR